MYNGHVYCYNVYNGHIVQSSRPLYRLFCLQEGKSIWRIVKEKRLLLDLFLVSLYGFCVQGIYYGYTFYGPLLISSNWCVGRNESSPTPVRSETECGAIKHNTLLELSLTSSVSPLGAVLAGLSAEWLGRRYTGLIVSVLLIVMNTFFYACDSPATLGFILGLVGIIKCAADLLPYLIASEYFPAEIRGFGMSVCVAGAKLGAVCGILLVETVFPVGPKYVAAVIHVLAAGMFITTASLTKETEGLKLGDT